MTRLKELRHIILYGLALALLIFVLKWLQWTFLIVDNAIEIYVGFIAVFFTVLGIWIASRLTRPRIQTAPVEKESRATRPETFTVNRNELNKLRLSSREYEVLLLLAKGHSNAEIAATLFLSVSTVKTHVSNLLDKMEVKNRTQATDKARRLQIIA